MPRGQPSEIGSKTINQNGYEQTKTEDGWIGSHILIMEEHLKRKLTKFERVKFIDGDRKNLTLENLELFIIKTGSTRKKIAQLEARIAELQAELEYHQKLLNESSS